MAPRQPNEQPQSGQAGQKRKRETGDGDGENEYEDDAGLGHDEEHVQEPADDNESDYDPDGDKGDDDAEDEEGAKPTMFNVNLGVSPSDGIDYNEGLEDLPRHPMFDPALQGIAKKVLKIPHQLLDQFPQRDQKTSIILGAHIDRAEELRRVPTTERLTIAMLGDAGVGKSSLLNAIADTKDLAKSASTGESCTCVPTIYCGAVVGQQENYGALIEYLRPNKIKQLLTKFIQDYNTHKFESEEDWDDAERLSARSAHDEALKMLLTLFIDLQNFRTKAAAQTRLEECYGKTDLLVEGLTQICVEKLKDTAPAGYIRVFEARSMEGLATEIAPMIASISSKIKKPALWPLVREVRISVRGSRVLDKVTIIDLPGISDTNQTRVELTHEYVKKCDYVWVVAPMKRVVDDETVNHLFRRYGRLCNGRICLICTQSDDGIINSAQSIEDFVEDNLTEQQMTQYNSLRDDMEKKGSKVNKHEATIAASKNRKRGQKMNPAKARENEEKLKKDYAKVTVKCFEALVHLRNVVISDKLREQLTRELPKGMKLEIYCVSNTHYAALNDPKVHWLKMSASATGIPKLRADTLALQAPSELRTLEQYMNGGVLAMLNDLALWASGQVVACRSELLELAQQLHDNLFINVGRHLDDFGKIAKGILEKALEPAIPRAREAAIKQLNKKFERHKWQTFMAFVRKNGRHGSRVCPPECWNEDYSKHFADALKQSEAALAVERTKLLQYVQQGMIDDLDKFKANIKGLKGAIPKGVLIAAIDSKIHCIRIAFTSNEAACKKDIRNVMLDLTLDSERNAFSRSMQAIYQTCAKDPNRKDITRRSKKAIEEHLSQTGKKSPFEVAMGDVVKQVVKVHRETMTQRIQPNVKSSLNQLCASLADLLDEKVVSEAEAAAKKDLRKVVLELQAEWKRASQDLEKVKKGYGM